MFGTDESAEIHLPAMFTPNGSRLWSYAQVEVHAPWFYIEYAVKDGEVKVTSMLLLSHVDQLVELSTRKDLQLTQVHLITPSYLNNSDSWQMDSLKQVIRATQIVNRMKVPITIFTLGDGRELIYGLINKRRKIRERRVVFSHLI